MSKPVAIVTGGAQGIGASICKVLLKEGYKVCVADINENVGNEFVDEQKKSFGSENVMFYYCDVQKESDYIQTFEETKKLLGKVNLLVNNAGINFEDFRKIINVNLAGPIIGCQTALRYMGKSNGGSGGMVINTASIAGLVPLYYAPVYVATKHGVVGLTRSYGTSYFMDKDGVIFTAICPSYTDTELVAKSKLKRGITGPLPECMSPDYVAESVIKLLEDKINGSVLVVSIRTGYMYVDIQDEIKDII